MSCSLAAALLTTGCAGSVPRLTAPPDLSSAQREMCEALGRATEAQVQGASVWGWTALGVVTGALAAVAFTPLFADSTVDATEGGVIIGAALAIGGSVGGLVGAGQAVARNASARDAAYTEAMNACLRPALLARELGREHLEVGQSLHALGYRYLRLWDFVRAEPLYARALAIEEKSLGADAPELAVILEDYAELLRRIGRSEEAEELQRRAKALSPGR